MAATGIFIGLSESDIIAIRDKAVAMLKEGKTIMLGFFLPSEFYKLLLGQLQNL